MAEKAKNEEKIIKMKQDIAYSMLNNNNVNCSNENDSKDNENSNDQLFEEMVLKLTQLIEHFGPFSDDLLLMAWKYESEKKNNQILSDNNNNTNRLWDVILKQIKYALNNPQIKKIWFWFEKYLLRSAVKWYIMYHI